MKIRTELNKTTKFYKYGLNPCINVTIKVTTIRKTELHWFARANDTYEEKTKIFDCSKRTIRVIIFNTTP